MAKPTHDTRWRHGRCTWSAMQLPEYFTRATGVLPLRGVLDRETGSEVFLCIKDSPQNVGDLARINKVHLVVKTGMVPTRFGAVMFLLFVLCDPARPADRFTYEVTLNPHDPNLMLPFVDLARQTHWHVYVLGPKNEELNWYEFENCYGLGEAIEQILNVARSMLCRDFDMAKQEYTTEYSIDDLLNS